MLVLKIFHGLTVTNKQINDDLNTIEKTLREARALMYKDFTPKIKNLPPLNIIDTDEILPSSKCFVEVPNSSKTPSSSKNTVPEMLAQTSSDIVSVVEVDVVYCII